LLFDFWHQLAVGETIHPADRPILERYAGVGAFNTRVPPGHISGPLIKSPVVVCYLNPGFGPEDHQLAKDATARAALFRQMNGLDPFPLEFRCWKKWFHGLVRSIGLPLEELANKVSIFNVCAYASPNADHISDALMKCLPSAQIARDYLHRVLLPAAQRDERFVVIGRGAWAWRVDKSAKIKNVKFTPNPRGPYLGNKLGSNIRKWLDSRSILPSNETLNRDAREASHAGRLQNPRAG